MSDGKESDRAAIRAAMDRLLAGIPLRSDGALTVVSLAVEAGVKRHLLTHRHVDLKDEFYARVRANGSIPEGERILRAELAEAKRHLAEAGGRIKQLKADREALARMVNVLTMENLALREASEGRQPATVVPFPPTR